MKSLKNLFGLVLVAVLMVLTSTNSFSQSYVVLDSAGVSSTEKTFYVGDTLYNCFYHNDYGDTRYNCVITITSIEDGKLLLLGSIESVSTSSYTVVYGDYSALNGDGDANFSLVEGTDSEWSFVGEFDLNDNVKFHFDINGTGDLVYLEINVKEIYNDGTPTSVFNPMSESNESVKLYPNPCVNTLNVSTDDYNTPLVSVYDASGRMVFNGETNSVDMSEYKVGMYLVSVNGETKKILKK